MSRHSQFFRAMAGFLLFLLLQLPAYSQSSLSGLQECSKPANASVCADLFGVKNALISANAPGTNAAVQLVGRIGSQAKTVANINVGGLVNSKAGMSVAAAGVAGLGAASLWGISADRLDGLRQTAFDKYCFAYPSACSSQYVVYLNLPGYGSALFSNPDLKQLAVSINGVFFPFLFFLGIP